MKKIILTSLIILSTLLVNSQTDSINLRLNRLEQNNEVIKINLTKCHKQCNTGLGFVGSGLIVSGFGTLIATTKGSTPKDFLLVTGAGGLISLVGTIIMIDSHKYIAKAGWDIKVGKITYTF